MNNTQTEIINDSVPVSGKRLYRNLLAFGLTSLLSDFCDEMATAATGRTEPLANCIAQRTLRLATSTTHST